MTSQPTGTAVGPIVTVAVEQTFPREKRLISDEIAYQFLPPVGKIMVTLARFTPARALLIGLTERDSPGIWGGMLRRKRYIDDKLVDALNAGISTVVNLGAS